MFLMSTCWANSDLGLCWLRKCGYAVPTRVPGLPIRNCAGRSNNLVPRGTKVSAIDVTWKVFCERLYWFQDWAHLSSKSTVRVLPHPHCSLYNYISISVQFFSDVAPHFLSAYDSPSNLAESRYPPPRGGFLFTMFPDQEPCVRDSTTRYDRCISS